MTDDHAEQVIDLLGQLLEEIKSLRSDFLEFTDHNTAKMSTLSSDITGPTGYHLGDLHERLAGVEHALALIEVNTSP